MVNSKENPEAASELELKIGLSFLNLGDFKEARKRLRKVIKDDPENSMVRRKLERINTSYPDSSTEP